MFSEILTLNQLKKFKDYKNVRGIVLSGGPSTVTSKSFEIFQKKFFQKNSNSWNLLQLTYTKLFGGSVKTSKKKRIWASIIIQKKIQIYQKLF